MRTLAAPAVRFPYGTEPTIFHSLFVGDRQMRKGRSSRAKNGPFRENEGVTVQLQPKLFPQFKHL